MHLATWQVDATKVLTRRELAAVLADLSRKAIRSEGAQLNRILVRLACCCGLRVTEIPVSYRPVSGRRSTVHLVPTIQSYIRGLGFLRRS